jgi:hypothetical protein
MYRLIYFNPVKGYAALDSDSNPQVIDEDKKLLQDRGMYVVCIVDYGQKRILNKSPDYAFHRDFIDELIFDYEFLTSNNSS